LIVAVPLFPSLVAVIVAIPCEIPLTIPSGETVAIALFEVVQTTLRPTRTVPPVPVIVASSCFRSIAPATRSRVFGEIEMAATDAGSVDERQAVEMKRAVLHTNKEIFIRPPWVHS
jgi:hypothetical protein